MNTWRLSFTDDPQFKMVRPFFSFHHFPGLARSPPFLSPVFDPLVPSAKMSNILHRFWSFNNQSPHFGGEVEAHFSISGW